MAPSNTFTDKPAGVTVYTKSMCDFAHSDYLLHPSAQIRSWTRSCGPPWEAWTV